MPTIASSSLRRGTLTIAAVLGALAALAAPLADAGAGERKASQRVKEQGATAYGCRVAGLTRKPCVRVSTLTTGRALDIVTKGTVAARIEAGRGGDRAKPFTTNATGVATGLNADRVDGLDVQQIIAAAKAGLPAGPVGPAGPPGPQGPAGTVAFTTRSSASSVGPAATSFGTADCEPGERAVSGGYQLSGTVANAQLGGSFPYSPTGGTPVAWRVVVANTGASGNVDVTRFVVCTR
jgi:hypothetical protein